MNKPDAKVVRCGIEIVCAKAYVKDEHLCVNSKVNSGIASFALRPGVRAEKIY